MSVCLTLYLSEIWIWVFSLLFLLLYYQNQSLKMALRQNWIGGIYPVTENPLEYKYRDCGSCTPEVEFECITWISSEASADFCSSSGWPKKATAHCCFGSGFFPHCSFTYHLHISTNNEKLGQPLLEQKSVVASMELRRWTLLQRF